MADSEAALARAWYRAQGGEVSDHGRLPDHVRTAYRQAHPTTAATEPPPMTAEFLTLRAVSAWTGLPTETLRAWRQAGNFGPPSFRLGQKIHYRRDDVQAWLNDQQRLTAHPTGRAMAG